MSLELGTLTAAGTWLAKGVGHDGNHWGSWNRDGANETKALIHFQIQQQWVNGVLHEIVLAKGCTPKAAEVERPMVFVPSDSVTSVWLGSFWHLAPIPKFGSWNSADYQL